MPDRDDRRSRGAHSPLDAIETAAAVTAASGQMDISHTIDYAVVEELYQMGGPSLMVQLFDLYREDVDRLRRELDHAQARNDAAEVARAAHAMSGCSASVGARTLAAAAKRLKLRAITGTLEECELLLADVVAESQRAISALEGVAKGLYPV